MSGEPRRVSAETVLTEAVPMTVQPGQAFFRRNVACVQLAFAAFWVVRGVVSAGIGNRGLAMYTAVAVIATVALAVVGVRRIGPLTRPRFDEPDVRSLTRRLSWATVVQLVASTVIGATLAAVGWDDWVVPSLVTTIGLFLIYAGHDLAVALTARVGWIMTLFSVLPVFVLDSDASSPSAPTVLALGTAALLAASSAACFVAGDQLGDPISSDSATQ